MSTTATDSWFGLPGMVEAVMLLEIAALQAVLRDPESGYREYVAEVVRKLRGERADMPEPVGTRGQRFPESAVCAALKIALCTLDAQ